MAGDSMNSGPNRNKTNTKIELHCVYLPEFAKNKAKCDINSELHLPTGVYTGVLGG